MVLDKIANYLIVFSLGLIVPIQYDLLTVGLLVIADLITGILAALRAGEKFECKKLKQTIIKIFLYEMVILMAKMMEHHIFHDSFPILNIILTSICFVEFTSLVENLSKYTGSNVGAIISSKLRSILDINLTQKNKDGK